MQILVNIRYHDPFRPGADQGFILHCYVRSLASPRRWIRCSPSLRRRCPSSVPRSALCTPREAGRSPPPVPAAHQTAYQYHVEEVHPATPEAQEDLEKYLVQAGTVGHQQRLRRPAANTLGHRLGVVSITAGRPKASRWPPNSSPANRQNHPFFGLPSTGRTSSATVWQQTKLRNAIRAG